MRMKAIDKAERVASEFGLTQSDYLELVDTRETGNEFVRRGQVVPSEHQLSVADEMRIDAFERFLSGRDFANFVEERIERDKDVLDYTVNPNTRGLQNSWRPQEEWTEDEYRWLMEQLIEAAPRNAAGQIVDPNNPRKVIDLSDRASWNLGHSNSRPWFSVKDNQEWVGLTQREIALMELRPEYWQIEDREENQSHRHEKVKPKRPVVSRQMPEGALVP